MTKLIWMEKYLNEAEQLFYDNQVEAGLAMLNSLLYEEPGYSALHNHLGWAYLYYTQDSLKAELHLKMAIHFNASFAAPYQHLGTLYTRSGQYGEAIAYLEKGLQTNKPNKVTMWQNIAHVYELQGEWSAAIKAYKKAMMASVADQEVNNLKAGIKRCRRKWVTLFFSKT